MANATVNPTSAQLYYGQWSNPDAEAPKLATPIDADDTTIVVSAPLKDSTGTVVASAFLMGIKKSTGFSEIIYVPAGGASADGLTLTGCVRGIKPDGYDFTVGSTDYATSHNADEPVYCVISAIIPELFRKVLQGVIASGGSDFIIGTDASGTVTIKRSTGVGTSVGFLRWYTTNSKAQYSNDGTTWVNIEDTAASVIFKVSATDTTAGYALAKIVAGSGVTITQTNIGGNETLVVASSLPDQIDEHATYTPAYLTGGASAESNPAIWDSVTDGAFQITINGTARSITGLDFSSITDMDGVAAVIQAGIRALTGSTETCVWSTDHFIITSADTTATSAMTVLTAGASGTDISGVGTVYMDSETGRGTVTNKVFSIIGDAGKVPIFGADGNLDTVFTGHASYFTSGSAIDGSVTPQALCVSDGTVGTAGRVFKADADDLTNMYVRFIGFTGDNVAIDSQIRVQTSGVIGGFTGLTPGVDYYLSSTAGAISLTQATNPAIRVGRAISTTQILIASESPIVQAYASTTTGLVLENAYIDVAFTIGFRPKALSAFFQMTGTDKSLSWGQWTNGTQHYIWDVDDGGACQRGSGTYIGQLYHDYAGSDRWQIDVQSFTNNTITLRYTARGAALTNTIVTNLLITG